MKDKQKVLLSFVIGAAAGVAAGMLLAPYSGKDSRKKLSDKATALSNDLGGQINTSLDKLNELKDSVISSISDLTGKAADKVNKAAEYGASKVKETAERAADYGNQAKS
ncbi:MAG: YtxH domain-containing protein [Bacteroidota bacterium]